MNLDFEKLLVDAMKDGIRKATVEVLTRNYQNPFDPIVIAALNENKSELGSLVKDSINNCMGDEAFRSEIKQALRTQLAKMLIQRFGGELEKQVNQLKSDPATRARITLALDQILQVKA